MGKAKKLRTMHRRVNDVVRYELSQYDQKCKDRKFDELVRRGIILEDKK